MEQLSVRLATVEHFPIKPQVEPFQAHTRTPTITHRRLTANSMQRIWMT